MTTGTKKQDERKRYLATLRDRMSAPADVMRQHMRYQSQNAALGLAAEVGVRDLLRLVLPQRLAVTSGFIRSLGRSLTEENPRDAVSGQTDVIVYDAMRVSPLHAAGGIEIVAAPDVLGVVEVKDTLAGSEDLGPGQGTALPHVAKLADHAPLAFRGVVLFRGKDDPSKLEIERARHCVAEAALRGYQQPHVIYCASYQTGDRESSLSEMGATTPYDQRLKTRFKQDTPYSVLCRFVTGSDNQGLPTAGVILQIQWKDSSKPMAAAFFYLTAPDVFTCTDAPGEEAWTIEGEMVDGYVKRVLTDEHLGTFNRPLRTVKTPGQAGSGAPSHGKDPS